MISEPCFCPNYKKMFGNKLQIDKITPFQSAKAAQSTSQKRHQEIFFWSEWPHLSKYTLRQHVWRLHCLLQGFKETRFCHLTYFIHKNSRREISMALPTYRVRRLFIYAARLLPDPLLFLRDVIAIAWFHYVRATIREPQAYTRIHTGFTRHA